MNLPKGGSGTAPVQFGKYPVASGIEDEITASTLVTIPERPFYVVSSDELLNKIGDIIADKIRETVPPSTATLSPWVEKGLTVLITLILSFIAARYGIEPTTVIVQSPPAVSSAQ